MTSQQFPPTRKSLGQHFLKDRRVLERIASALHLTGTETVIEIGPGRGALTDILAAKAGRLIAIEYDRALAPLLRERYAASSNVLIVEADVLSVDLAELAQGPFVLAGNVPYYITTPILFHALRTPRPETAVYLVQREVAERLTAKPGTKEYGALTINVAAVAHAEMLFAVPASAFVPEPNVESAVVRIKPRPDQIVADAAEQESLRLLVQGAFGMRRKQMQRILRSLRGIEPEVAAAQLEAAGIEPTARPETLSVEQFVRVLRSKPGV